VDWVQIKLGLHTGGGTFIEEGSNGFRLFLLFAKWLTDRTEALDFGSPKYFGETCLGPRICSADWEKEANLTAGAAISEG